MIGIAESPRRSLTLRTVAGTGPSNWTGRVSDTSVTLTAHGPGMGAADRLDLRPRAASGSPIRVAEVDREEHVPRHDGGRVR